jgi:hypothetical protein
VGAEEVRGKEGAMRGGVDYDDDEEDDAGAGGGVERRGENGVGWEAARAAGGA